MNIKRLVDTVVAGTGMSLIHSAVKIKDGKLADNNKLLLLGIVLTSVGGVMTGVRAENPDFKWCKPVK